MKTGLKRLETATSRNFTTKIGMDIRKEVNGPWRIILKSATKREIIIEDFPILEKNKSYIFACNHSFDEDVISLLSSIDRNAYVLNGTTDQTEHNPVFYALWANGMVYTNRLDDYSREMSIFKMERVIYNGNGMLIFVGGGYNNTENRMVENPFNGAATLNHETGKEVVPMISFNEFGSDKIYIRAGKPLDLRKYDVYEGGHIIQDALATIYYDILCEHTEMIARKDLLNHMIYVTYIETLKKKKKKQHDLDRVLKLPNDPRAYWMEMRKLVYEAQKWYNDVWHEELTKYAGHGVTTPEESRKYVDLVHITAENAAIFADTLVRREEDKYFDLEQYLRENVKLQRSLKDRLLDLPNLVRRKK